MNKPNHMSPRGRMIVSSALDQAALDFKADPSDRNARRLMFLAVRYWWIGGYTEMQFMKLIESIGDGLCSQPSK